MPDNTIYVDGRSIRIVSLGPGQPITGVVSGSGPRVTIRRRGADPTDEDASATLDTLLVDEVGGSCETVALLLTERMSWQLGPLVVELASRRVTLSAEPATTSRGLHILDYQIRPA